MVIRIGFIGAGGVARRHARTLTALGGVRVVAVADISELAARDLAAPHGARAHGHHRDMLDQEDLDAVYVCVPPFAHGRPEEDVLARGLPMFVEKPLARDLATAERLGEMVARTGVVTATGYHWRHLDVVVRARQLLAGRPIGLVHAAWLDKVPPPAWWPQCNGSGGQIVEQATHVLDLVRLLCGEVREVQAVGTKVDGGTVGDVDDATAAVLRLESGAIGVLTATSLLARKARAAVHVEAAGLHVEVHEDGLVADDGDTHEERRAAPTAKVEVDRAFIAAVRDAGDPAAIAAPYAEALRTHRLACAIAESAGTERPVRVTEAHGA